MIICKKVIQNYPIASMEERKALVEKELKKQGFTWAEIAEANEEIIDRLSD